jgi:hypothetical protein
MSFSSFKILGAMNERTRGLAKNGGQEWHEPTTMTTGSQLKAAALDPASC